MCPETDLLKRLVESSIDDEMNAARRAGTSGPWCFACCHESADLGACSCAFPSEFGCVRLRNLCADCRRAHRKVAAHLEPLFAAKRLRVHRADSRRCNFYRFLRDALEVLSEAGDAQAKILRTLINRNADPRA